METLDQMMERLKKEKEQMYGGGNTPPTPSVDTTALEQSQIMKTEAPTQEPGMIEKAFNKAGSFWMGAASGVITGASNIAWYWLDVVSWLWQDIKENLQWDFWLWDTYRGIVWERKSDLWNAARDIGSAIGNNPYWKMWTDESAFSAWQWTSEFWVWLWLAWQVWLLSWMWKVNSVWGLAGWLWKEFLKWVVTNEIMKQTMEWEWATMWDRLIAGWLGTLFWAGKAALETKIAKDVVIPKWLGWSGKWFRWYLSDRLAPETVEEANKMLLKAIPQLSTESAKNMWRTSVLIDDEMRALKKGWEYILDWKKIAPREAFWIATDNTMAKLGIIQQQVLKNSNDFSFAEFAQKSGVMSKLDELNELTKWVQKVIDPKTWVERTVKSKWQLYDLIWQVNNFMSKWKVSWLEFENMRNAFKASIEALPDSAVRNELSRLQELSSGAANKYMDDILWANWFYVNLKKDMSNLKGIQSVTSRDNVKRGFMTWEDAMSSSAVSWDAYDKTQALWWMARWTVGWYTTAAVAFIRNNLKLADKFSKNQDELFEAAYDYFSKNPAPVTQLEQYASRKAIEQRAAEIVQDNLEKTQALENVAKIKSKQAEISWAYKAQQANKSQWLQIADDLFKKKQAKEAMEATAKNINKSVVESITPWFIWNLTKAKDAAKEVTKNKWLQIADDLFKKKQLEEATKVTSDKLNKAIVESITPSIITQLKKAWETAKETRLRLAKEALLKIK